MSTQPLKPNQAAKSTAAMLHGGAPICFLLVALKRISLLPELLVLASIGLALHILASFITPTLVLYTNLGNPAMWYPSCAWALASFIVLRRLLIPSSGTKQKLLLLGALLAMFLLLSMAHTVFAYPAASLDKLITRNVVVLVLAATALVLMGLSTMRMALLIIPALLVAAGYFASGSTAIGFLASGMAAFATLGGFIYLDRTEADTIGVTAPTAAVSAT